MKRVLSFVLLPFFVVGALSVYGVNRYFVDQMEQYEPMTLEAPYAEPGQIEEFALDGRRTPADFGFPVWHDVEASSLLDSTRLSGWYLPAADTASRRVIVLAHGRWSNRLKPATYLPLLKAAGLDSSYHVLAPDLRNSGASAPAPTGFGYRFAEDLAGWLVALRERYGLDTAVLYGFSMGAMGSALLLDRPDLRTALADAGIAIDRVVLDSPLSNVDATVRRSAIERQGLPEWVVDLALYSFDQNQDGYLPRMRLGTILAETEVPVLILQGEADRTTPNRLLQAEAQTFGPNVRLHTFPEAGHVKIYRHPEARETYAALVADFLRGRRDAPIVTSGAGT